MQCSKCEKEYSQPILPFHIKRCNCNNNENEEVGADYSIVVNNSMSSVPNLDSGGTRFKAAHLIKEFPYDEITLNLTDDDTPALNLIGAFENWSFKNAPKIANMSDSRFTSVDLTLMFDKSLVEDVPIYDTSKCSNLGNMFRDCNYLSETSLDNILQMCVNSKVTSSTKKKLSQVIGNCIYGTGKYSQYSRSEYPDMTEANEIDISTLPHYQNFIDAGWTLI